MIISKNMALGFTVSTVALSCALAVQPALAQNVDPASKTADQSVVDSASAAQMVDIVVTAQRREQRLQEAPVAVTALNSNALEQLNVSQTSQLQTVVPSLQISTQTAGDGGGSATFFIRGFGQQRSGNGSEPAVGIYVDDFYYPSLSGTIFEIVDLKSVEVLRGPQGTLFGRNTIGGAIRYQTQAAEVGEFSGHVTGTLGRFDRRDIAGGVNIPVGSVAALRLTAGHLERDGFVRNQTTNDSDGDSATDLVRLQARIEPTSDVYVDISSQYSLSKLRGFTYTVPGPVTPVPPAAGQGPTLPYVWNSAVAPNIGAPLYTDQFKSACYYCHYGTEFPEFSRTRYQNALVTIGWNLNENFTVKSLTGWQDVKTRYSNDLDSSPLRIFNGSITPLRTKAFSQEIQLNGKKLLDNRLNFVAGGFYYNQRDPAQPLLRPNYVLGGPSPDRPTARTLKSYAGFVDGSFELMDKLSLLAGFRYSSDRKTITVRDANGVLLANGAKTFSSSTYRAGFQYRFTPDANVYFNVSSGFRGGGFNPYFVNAPNLRSFSPEKSTSFEGGARFQFMDRRITINPTIFYVKYSDIQVQSVYIVGGSPEIVLQNAAKARSYGAELEASASVSDHFRVFGNLSYLNIKYTDIGQANGITVSSGFQRAPKFSGSLGASYTVDLGDSGYKAALTVNGNYVGKQRSTPTDSDFLTLHKYGLLNGRLELTAPEDKYSIALFVTNITNKRYFVGGVNYYSNVGAARYDLGAPREFGVTGRVNF